MDHFVFGISDQATFIISNGQVGVLAFLFFYVHVSIQNRVFAICLGKRRKKFKNIKQFIFRGFLFFSKCVFICEEK